ncbi:endonuclease/exonuclease/phosphatase family protein [Sphingomonas sp. G-3-2-10]|uniref:endonuclease/exonuclease/phosphatase family protein n=1 Tax=Sphingomonas sp. G-3-2-10 TaxID=2728838 RepID=UPI00146E0649|nr:endonuclease/exonuclease/phosphatase family protein [Sphingomonas sp. G-3-2-10]NML08065.1 endonuclease [Sphingomonas sp. G-3-2-10]
MRSLAALSSVLLLALSSCATPPTGAPVETVRAERPLKLASWNLEFLAEREGVGCQPRTAADYAAMRRIADSLNADVIAFQEVESVAAAQRVFDPAKYDIVMEDRPGKPSGTCGGSNSSQTVIRQAVGFAIRKGLAFDRNPDVTSLMIDNPQLRSGVDITLRAAGYAPIRLLVIHLKSGCFAGSDRPACPVLLQQIPALEAWIDQAARDAHRFAVLGDWNRRLGLPGDLLWTEIDDGDPANADLLLSDAGTDPHCDPRYDSFIDHIVLDRRSGAELIKFSETLYAPGEKHYSDHCPITVTLSR